MLQYTPPSEASETFRALPQCSSSSSKNLLKSSSPEPVQHSDIRPMVHALTSYDKQPLGAKVRLTHVRRDLRPNPVIPSVFGNSILIFIIDSIGTLGGRFSNPWQVFCHHRVPSVGICCHQSVGPLVGRRHRMERFPAPYRALPRIPARSGLRKSIGAWCSCGGV